MTQETTTISQEELVRLQARMKKSGMDKAYLELVIRLMNRVSAASGLENTIDTVLRNIVDVIGGTNIVLYYWIDAAAYCADV